MRVRRPRKEMERLNLIPILDAVFIFIFFLLMSAKFVNLRQIGSDLPVVSESEPPPKQKEPLALTIEMTATLIKVKTGNAGNTILTLSKKDNVYDFQRLHQELVNLKRKHTNENSVILSPDQSTPYEDIVQVIDQSRMLRKDETPLIVQKGGEYIESRKLFPKIVFSNLDPNS